jgi:hypothetical protein
VRRPGQNEMRPGRRTLLHVRLSVGLGLNFVRNFNWESSMELLQIGSRA